MQLGLGATAPRLHILATDVVIVVVVRGATIAGSYIAKPLDPGETDFSADAPALRRFARVDGVRAALSGGAADMAATEHSNDGSLRNRD